MEDTSNAEPAPHTNGLVDAVEDDYRYKQRPADIDADMREMERRKRVEIIMNSRLFREELERIIELQIKDGGAGTSHLLQQISDMTGVPKHANVFKGPNCVLPINDIRGVESMGYAKGEKLLRCKLASIYRLMDLYGWSKGVSNQLTARLNQDQEHFLVNPYGMLSHEITASSLVKIDMQGNVVEQGTTNFGVNINAFSLHAAIHSARPDLKCAVHVHTPAVMAVSALKCGLLPISQESIVIGDVSMHPYSGGLAEPEEREKVARNLGLINKVLLLANHGAVCCGETVEETFFNVFNMILACETQLKLMPVGIDNLALVSEESRKQMYDAARKAPDGTASKSGSAPEGSAIAEKLAERKWRVGGVEFEALMRMLDNAGFRTGYIYRNPLVKGEPPRPRNDVEVPPAVSSLGYLLEEEEMYRQGIWKPGRKGNDHTHWLSSPNVYQKEKLMETGTPNPKEITKWVADGSPTHSSTPVKIDATLQFVPKNTNPKEFKLLQQQIKDNRRADKISAGPQSHILEGVSWEEAKKMQDAGFTQTGDQVVVVGAASKGIIQRGYQHNAMVYKAPYAKNPFDSVTDEELDEYKKVIEKKARGEYDTDYSESEGLSSAQISKRVDELNLRSPTSATSETEEDSRDEPRVLRIETKQAPKPSQPEVVHSDGYMNYAGVPATFRSRSHAGMPRGKFISPQPKHFHLQGGISLTEMRAHPLFQRFNKIQQAYIHTQPIRASTNTNITVNIDTPNKTLSINLPLDTVKEFITPFNKALDCAESNRTHGMVQNYIDQQTHSIDSENHYEYDFSDNLNNNDEKHVLHKQRDVVMRDLNDNVALLELDTSFSDLEVVDEVGSESEHDHQVAENVIDFAKKITKYNFLNESILEVQSVRIWDKNDDKQSATIINITKNEAEGTPALDSNANSNIDTRYEQEMVTIEKLSNKSDSPNENDCNRCSGDSILRSVMEISKGYDQILADIRPDEKIWPDEACITAIKQISKKIYKYIMHVCVETIEALEFPDIRCYHDSEKFFDEILFVFEKYIDLFPEENDIKSLKECVMNSVVKCMEKYFVIIPVTKDNTIDTKIANRKLFALKKFLTLIIYILFDKIENPDFQCTHYDMPNLSCFGDMNLDNIKHSTPENCNLYYTLSESSEDKNEHETSFEHYENEPNPEGNIYANYDQVLIPPTSDGTITTFLSQRSPKSGNSKYWFMINDKIPPRKSSLSLLSKSPVATEKVRRVSAPARFMPDVPRALSPIMEEPRKSLLHELSHCDDPDDATIILNRSYSAETVDEIFEEINDQSQSENDKYETPDNESFYDVSTSSNESGSSKDGSKVVFTNQVTFITKPNIKTDYDAARSETSVRFVPDDNITARLFAMSLEESENSYISSNSLTEEEDNWMGFDSAKF